MKKSICFFVFLFITHCTITIKNCPGQWVQMSNGMGTNKTAYSFATLGNNIYAGTSLSGVYVSTDYGTSWTQTALNNVNVYALAVSGNSIYAGTNNGVFLSTNNGTNWTNITIYINLQYSALAVSGNNIYAGANNFNGLYLSTNNGTNWTNILNSQSVWSVATTGNNIYAGTSSGVYMSTNNGTNWTHPMTIQPVSSVVISGNNIFAGTHFQGTSSGVYLSTNNGTNWIQTTLVDRYVYSLAINANNIFAGTDNGWGVYLSTNNGTSWIQKSQGFVSAPLINSFLFANNYIFVGTSGLSVWRRDLSEILTVSQQVSNIVPLSYSLSQNYPNPFNPTTKIKYSITTKQFIKLKVFDILGRAIITLVNENKSPGTYSVDWNASDFSSGIYFYHIETESFTDTKRMTLLK